MEKQRDYVVLHGGGETKKQKRKQKNASRRGVICTLRKGCLPKQMHHLFQSALHRPTCAQNHAIPRSQTEHVDVEHAASGAVNLADELPPPPFRAADTGDAGLSHVTIPPCLLSPPRLLSSPCPLSPPLLGWTKMMAQMKSTLNSTPKWGSCRRHVLLSLNSMKKLCAEKERRTSSRN